jgi:hypothetical protein
LVRATFIGFHCWPLAPDEVSFLRNKHRHVFHVSASFVVDHSDRALEFFMVQNTLRVQISELDEMLRKNMHMSCEMMAEFLLTRLHTTYGEAVKVMVSEDGENGAKVEII